MTDGGLRELNYPAIASFLVFIIATLFITAYAALRTQSRNDFYVAGSTIGGLQNGIAISGDYMSAASFLGLVGLLFIGGYDTIYFIVNLILSWAVVLLLIAEKLRNLGSYTFADAVSVRLAPRPIRVLAATGTLAVAIPYLLAQMVAAGTLVESLFGLSLYTGRTHRRRVDDDLCDVRRHDCDHLGPDNQGDVAGRRRYHTRRWRTARF